MTEEPNGTPEAPQTSAPAAAASTLPKKKVPFWSPDSTKRKVVHAIVIILLVLGLATAWFLLANWKDWGTDKMVVFSIPFLIALAFGILFHKVMRAKTKVYADWLANNPDDPQGKEILVIFNWSSKVLYIYTIVLCLINAGIMVIKNKYGVWSDLTPEMLGGIWLGFFFVNFMVEEYEVNLTALLIIVGFVVATLLWFAYMDWWQEFIRFFRKFGIEIDAAGYVLIGLIFFLAILYSWIRGAFHYVAITPNYMNIQSGVTETGEQIKPDSYTTRIDAGDLLERWMPFLNFGKVIITFRDTRRMPMVFLVHRVRQVAKKLERIQGILRVDGRDR